MAYISLVCAPEKMEDGFVVIGLPGYYRIVSVSIHRLNDRAHEQTGLVDNWGLRANIMPGELEQKPFRLEFVKKLVKLTRIN